MKRRCIIGLFVEPLWWMTLYLDERGTRFPGALFDALFDLYWVVLGLH
jgi:hypothetical protein